MLKRLRFIAPIFGLFFFVHALGSNVLVVILDDVGADVLNVYRPHLGLPQDGPPTPTIDKLADRGMVFLNAWANPICAATRATITYGRYGLRTGILIASTVPYLPQESVPEILLSAGAGNIATAMIGKWGLGSPGPLADGFEFTAGTSGTGIPDYCLWIRDSQGDSTWSQTYATTK